MIDYYKSLPDYITVYELKMLLINFSKEVEDSKCNLYEEIESLLELSDRQWHTYELLDNEIKSKIEIWLINIVDFNSVEVMECLTSIIGRLGLTKLYQIVKDSLKDNINYEVKQIIHETISELDGHVDDPYFGMK